MHSFKTFNPYNDSLIGEFPFATATEVEKVLDLLQQGRKTQKQLSAHKRSEILNNLSILLEENSEELSRLITIETGKTISESRIELSRAKNTAFCASVEARNITGEVIDSDSYQPLKGKIAIVRKRPIGTILCITPFNFPINLALHKIAPAFAAGNSIFFRPGPHNYQSAKLLVELCYKAGMPKDVIAFCYPDIDELTKIIQGDKIQCISFTGGTKTAKEIAKNAGMKKLLLELGGNDPVIIMPDADIESAVVNTINNRFGTAGQKCTASKRVFVHAGIYDQFKRMIIEKSKDLVIGDPMDENTFCGPLISKKAADEVESLINEAIGGGANVLLGAKRSGNIIHPTILENLNKNSPIICNETFGPVIPLIKFDDINELIKDVNSTDYGLQAGVFTNDLRVIEQLYEELEVGSLAVNDGPGFRAEHFPFGGIKQSGIGREGIKYAINEMSVIKSLVM